MMLYKPGRDDGVPPSPDAFAKLNQVIAEQTKAGILLATDGLLPSAAGARVQKTDSGFKVTDGPFAEAKEVIAGYAIMNLASKEEAIERTKEFLTIMGAGATEIRPMFDAANYDPSSQQTPAHGAVNAKR
jgi:hypothetical protein